MGVYLGVSHASNTKWAEFKRSPILGSPVFFLHPLTQNDQVRHGNPYGEGRQPRRCVARVRQQDI